MENHDQNSTTMIFDTYLLLKRTSKGKHSNLNRQKQVYESKDMAIRSY